VRIEFVQRGYHDMEEGTWQQRREEVVLLYQEDGVDRKRENSKKENNENLALPVPNQRNRIRKKFKTYSEMGLSDFKQG
jgi:hypothetical protein